MSRVNGEGRKGVRGPRNRGVPGFSPKLMRELRVAVGMTQNDLAIAAGVPSAAVISMYENSRHTPSADTLNRLAEALDVEPELLCRRAGDGDRDGDI